MNQQDKVDLVFKNLTRGQALTLSSWYEAQGEQDQDIWFDIQGVPSPCADVSRPGGYREETENQVIVHLRTL